MEKNMIQPIYPQLRFGVVLHRLFPPWYLHPALKNLIYETRINTERRKEFTLEELFLQEENVEYLRYQNEILYLKDRLVSGKNILGLNASPGVHLWLLRNFLGMLPTPPFPKNNIRPNSWINLSIQCKDTLIMMRIKSGTSTHLEDIVAREFSDLPPRNLTLILELFELFRTLGTQLFIKTEIDKRAAMAIVRYFTPCLFSRPFRPGITTTTEKRLYALVLFTIFNWPSIKEKCQTILSNSYAEFELSKLYYLPSFEGSKEKINKPTVSEEEILNQIKSNNDVLENTNELNDHNNDDVVYLVENFTQTSMSNLYQEDSSSPPCETALHISLEDIHNDNCEKESISSVCKEDDNDSFRKKTTNEEEKIEDISFRSGTSNEIKIDKVEPKRRESKEGKLDSHKRSNHSVNLFETEHDTGDSKRKGSQEGKLDLHKRSNLSVNLFDAEPKTNEIELIKFDKETSNTLLTKDQNVQVTTPKRSYPKIGSSKLTKIKTNYKRDSQIIVLHINPCKCYKEPKKPKKKTGKSSEEFKDAESSHYFEEKNNFESPEKATKTQQVQYENLLDTPNLCCNYSKNINSNFDDIRKPFGWTLPGSSLENNNGYMYDSFIGGLHRESEYFETSQFSASNPFHELNSPKTEALRERMAKIGWTYEDKSSSVSPRSKSVEPSPRTDFKNQYKLCFDTEYKAGTEDSKDSNFMLNLKKFGSKLNIFKTRTPKLKTLSAENLLSNVKYKSLTKRSNSI